MTLSDDELAREFLKTLPNSPSAAINPGHRVDFRWPPRAVSLDYHLPRGAWQGKETVTIQGERYDLEVAQAYEMTFGRIEVLRAEAAGKSRDTMISHLTEIVTPFIKRSARIAKTLGLEGRFVGNVRELAPLDLLRLLYCPDRDVAHEASVAIETHASSGVFTPSLILALRDENHPNRRIAQWCVLDMFEDLPSFARTAVHRSNAIQAIKEVMWDADDDYARAVFKAGVVLGGHIATPEAAEALIGCLFAPSKIGRRSAIHAVFHLVEWLPARRGEVLTKLRNVASDDSEPQLRSFAAHIAQDIEHNEHDHSDEPLFPEESLA